MEIVVNEWLLDYMCPNVDLDKKDIANKFLSVLLEKCDKIVIGRGTPFVKKFYRYMKDFGRYHEFKSNFSKLNQLLFLNSDKTIILEKEEVAQLPKEINEILPPDDKYLFELAYTTTDKIIVTTDQRLYEKVKNITGLRIYLLEEFLKLYIT